MSDFIQLLHAKRDGHALSHSQVSQWINGVVNKELTDAQIGAFNMAVCYQGMTHEEQVAMTLAMRDSGSVMRWDGLDGPVLDKHSTGGIGDMVSLILAPILASCGAYLPMISGRGLGHTGGTLDKLESIPGFEVFPSIERLQAMVRKAGAVIVGQTDELAPADRRIYAIRDNTSTIASIPLIVGSILSKKLAEGLEGLVLDIKAGNGAFMRDLEEARTLARQLAEVSAGAGVSCSALLTDMNQPLAWSAGNALEVRESIEFLKGKRHPRLEAVTMALCSAAMMRTGMASSQDEAMKQLTYALDSGRAAERFAQMVAIQNGPTDLLDAPEKYLERAPVVRTLLADRSGFVQSMNTLEIGLVVMRLGGGRQKVEDTLDHRVGLADLVSVGDHIQKGSPLATIHAANEDDALRAMADLHQCFGLSDTQTPAMPLIYDQIDAAAG